MRQIGQARRIMVPARGDQLRPDTLEVVAGGTMQFGEGFGCFGWREIRSMVSNCARSTHGGSVGAGDPVPAAFLAAAPALFWNSRSKQVSIWWGRTGLLR